MAMRHAITDGRKLEHIVHHSAQGMISLIALHYHKWRFLPDKEVQTFAVCRHYRHRIASDPRCDVDDGYLPPR
jgi:hypothetical protein